MKLALRHIRVTKAARSTTARCGVASQAERCGAGGFRSSTCCLRANNTGAAWRRKGLHRVLQRDASGARTHPRHSPFSGDTEYVAVSDRPSLAAGSRERAGAALHQTLRVAPMPRCSWMYVPKPWNQSGSSRRLALATVIGKIGNAFHEAPRGR